MACPVNGGFLGDDLAAIVYGPLSGEACLTCAVVASFLSDCDRSRKGFRESGLSGAALGILLKVVVTGDGSGDAVRLRKGLFDDRFAVRPGDGSLGESVVQVKLLANGRRVGSLGERLRRAMSSQGT